MAALLIDIGPCLLSTFGDELYTRLSHSPAVRYALLLDRFNHIRSVRLIELSSLKFRPLYYNMP